MHTSSVGNTGSSHEELKEEAKKQKTPFHEFEGETQQVEDETEDF